MRLTRMLMAATVAVGVLVGGAGPAAAAKPTIERISVDDTFVDRFLSRECGVRVVTQVVGRITFKTWDRTRTGPVAMTNVNLTFTATVGDNTYRFKDVGADLVRRQPDGTLVLQIAGQVPFGFKGVLRINLYTGEVLHEPTRTVGTEKACAALTAD
jgi:hypothetical protein